MNKSMRKTTLREITRSLGRYIAIVAITALGVGFFAGLKACQPAMVNAADKYLEENLFYDFRVLSSYGLEQEDVEALAEIEEVAVAEGGYSTDVIYEYEDVSGVLKVHSLGTELNHVVLTAGRMPQAPGECLVDANVFTEEAIGTEIVLSQSNEEDTLDQFAEESFVIVGIAKSPNYLNFERGTTTLANGVVDGFMYVSADAFDMEVYTEVYLRLEDRHRLYSEEYDAYVEEVADAVEAVSEDASARRYEVVLAEAWEELEDGEQELADAIEEGETELADAWTELNDGARELQDGIEELEEGRQELLDAEEDLADARVELADAEIEVADAEVEIADALVELADGEQELLDAEAELADAAEQLREAEETLADARQEIANGFAILEQKFQELEDAREELDAQGSMVNSGIGQVESGMNQIREALAMREQLEGQLALLPPLPEYAETIAALEAALSQIPSASELNATMADLQNTYNYLYDKYLLCLQASRDIAYADQQLCLARGDLYAAQEEADEGERELWDARIEYNEGLAQYQEGLQELEDARIEIADAQQELEDARIEIADGWEEVADAEIEIADGWIELEDAEREIAEGRYDLERGYMEYYRGRGLFYYEIDEAREELADARADIEALEAPDTFVLDRESNVGLVCFENDSAIVDSVAYIFPVFFFLVVALVCITTMNRMIEEQRTQIGVLKAMGYSAGTIMAKYLFYAGSAALFGGVGGFLFGSYLFPTVIWITYGMMYNFADLEYTFMPGMFVISIAVALLCTMGATWLSCRKELQSVPAELIRPKSPKAGKRILVERITFLWKRLPFLHKVSLRNIFRYKKRVFMMIIGISGCTALLVAGFGLKDSVAGIVTQQYEQIEPYDMSILLSEGYDEEGKAEFAQTAEGVLTDYAYLSETTMDIIGEEMTKTVCLRVPEEEDSFGEFVRLETQDGRVLPYPSFGEVVLSDKVAEKIGAEIGSEILLRDSDMNEITVTVAGIYNNYISNYAYISLETYEDQMGHAPEYKTVFAYGNDGIEIHECGAQISEAEGVVSVSITQDMKDRMDSTMESLNYIVILVISCAGLLAFIVLYNLTNINITERIREIATIKVLGFYPEETASYVFRENVLLSFVGGAIGLLLGKFLHAFVMDKIDVDMVSFDVLIMPLSYLFSFILTFVFAMVVNRFMRGKLNRIDMAESLKSVE